MNDVKHDTKQPAMRDAILHLLFLTLLFSLAFVPTPGWAQIVEHFELVRDSKNVTWTDLEGTAVRSKRASSNTVTVTPGERAQGMFNRGRGIEYREAYGKTPTLDLQTLMPAKGKERGSRALWQNRLPIARHLQAEISYETILDAADREPSVDFALIVEEVDAKSPTGWRSAAAFDVESVRPSFHASAGRLATAGQERFKQGSFIANLTPWAGKYVRLAFEARFQPGTPGLMRARWLQSRLVSSDFRVTLSEPVRDPHKYSNSLKSATATIYAATEGSAEDVKLLVVTSYPDTGFTVENFQGRQIGYGSSAFLGYNPQIDGANLVIDLDDSDDDFNDASVSEMRDGLIRNPAGVPYLLPGSGNHNTKAWPVLLRRNSENLDNHYSGICGSVSNPVDVSLPYLLHAVVHCEDKSDSDDIYSTTHDVMTRIAYARSQSDESSDDAYHFTRTAHTTITSPTSPEGYAIITPPFTEARYRDLYQENNPEEPIDLWGDGTPHILKSGDYYYCFYTTRLYKECVQNHYTDTEKSAAVGVCVARATASAIETSSYSSNANPWHKWQNDGSWGSDGLGGWADFPGKLNNRWHPKVSWNREVDRFVMACEGASQEASGFYIHSSTDITDHSNWDEGMCMLVYPATGSRNYPSIIGGSDGTDKETSEYNMLYF